MEILDLTNKLPSPEKKTDHIYNFPENGKLYDEIVCENYVASCEFNDIPETVSQLIDRLAPGGRIHIIEPSAEWVAREIIRGNIDVVRNMHAFGTGGTVFRSFVTLNLLRDLVSKLGLIPKVAGSQPYPIARDSAGREFTGDQHYVVAEKPGGEGRTWVR